MNFSTNILLSPEENNRYQAIYASQRYGTFFGLYGKFNIEKKGKKTLLHGIDLKLMNYKGILNMSIENKPDSIAIDEEAVELNRDLNVVLLKVQIRAKINDPNYEGSLRLLHPIEITGGTYFSVISDLIPLCGHKDIKAPYQDGVFDDEFFFRDGISNVERKVTDIDLDIANPRIPDEPGYRFKSKLLPNLDDRFGSIRCRVGNNKIITD
jgi:hypothetical protein